MTREEIIDLIETALLDSTDIDCTYLSQSRHIVSILEDAGAIWTPENNTTRWDLLTENQQSALESAEHGWEICSSFGRWVEGRPNWLGFSTYRAKSAPK